MFLFINKSLLQYSLPIVTATGYSFKIKLLANLHQFIVMYWLFLSFCMAFWVWVSSS